MENVVTIRPIEVGELPIAASFWLAMYEEAGLWQASDFVPDWRERYVRYFERRITAGEAQLFVALEGERIIGTAGAVLADGYPTIVHGLRFGYIFGVRVEPEFRGRGLATSLTRATIAFLHELRCVRIRLHASKMGRPIYERIGFIPTNEMSLPS
jgi:GNAT superfamily N-acetyltransferase